jgi:uncharacterized membrane protein (UPF0127 family)
MTILLTTLGKLRFGAVFALFFLLAALPAVAQEASQAFESEVLSIQTAGQTHVFTVEMALSPAQQRQGLMYRRELASDRGMLFVLQKERPMRMWMKNTYIPLDMLFIDSRGRIVYIAPRTTPLSESVITAGRPVAAVLELAGGVAQEKNIQVGDKVLHPHFRQE